MLGFSRVRRSSIALDAGPASVAFCQLGRCGGRLRLERSAVIEDPLRERPAATVSDERAIERTRRVLQDVRLRGHTVGIALKPPDVAFHTVAVPAALQAAPRRELLPALKLEASRQLQVEPGELEIDYWPLPPGNRSGENLMIVATRRSAVEAWERFVASLGLTLTCVDVLPCALLRAAWSAESPAAPASAAGPQTLWGVLDVGFGGALLTLAVGSCCVYVRPLSPGGDTLTLAVADALQVDYKTAELLKRSVAASDGPAGERAAAPGTRIASDVQQVVEGVLRAQIRALAAEVERALAYALESYPQAQLGGIHVCGGGARLGLLAGGLREALGIDVRQLDPAVGLAAGAADALQRPRDAALYAGCIGVALGELLN